MTTYNKDLDPNNDSDYSDERTWVQKKLDLYATWRSILIGADGINVQYDAVEGRGTNAPVDHTLYLDSALAVVQPAAKPLSNDEAFRYWVLQKWDGEAGEFVDIEPLKQYVPGDTFTVLLENARTQPNGTDGQGNPKYIYTVQLRAEYGPKDSPTPTHIDWYKNYGSDPQSPEYSDLGTEGKGLKINEAVSIYTPQNRSNYTFIGWARVPNTVSNSYEDENGTFADLLDQSSIEEYMYLYYFDGKYYLDVDKTKEVTQVAADERTPYHDMYAMWERKTADLTINKTVVVPTDAFTIDTTKEFNIKVVLSEALPTDYTAPSGVTLGTDRKTFTFKLKHNGSIVLPTLPVGATYTIGEEQLPSGYTPDGANPTSGDIREGTDNKATLKNNYAATGKASFPVKKVVESETANTAPGAWSYDDASSGDARKRYC